MKTLVPILLALALCVTFTSGEQNIRISRTVPKKNGKVLLKAKCVFKTDVKILAGEREFDISLDTYIEKFKSKQVKSLTGVTGTFFEVETIKVMRPDKFVVKFSGLYVGDANTTVPTGTCSDMRGTGETTTTSTTTSTTEAPTTSTTTEATTTSTSTTEPTTSTTTEPTTTSTSTTEPTTSTTTEPTTTSTSTTEPTTSTTTEPTTTSTSTTEPTTSTTTEPTTTSTSTTEPTTSTTTEPTTTPSTTWVEVAATVHKTWPAGSCTSVYAYCDWPVDFIMEPGSRDFNISFNTRVKNFKHWVGETLQSDLDGAGEASWFHTTNVYTMQPPRLRYAFQFTISSNTVPAITCRSTTDVSITTTNPWTSESTTTSTTTMPSTSESTTTSTTTMPSTSESTTTSTTTMPSTSESTSTSTTTTMPSTSESTSTSTTTTMPTTSESTTTIAQTTTDSGTTTASPGGWMEVPATVHKTWPSGTCTRFYAYCDWPVDEIMAPGSTQVNISFSASVRDFKQWAGTVLDSDTAQGQWYYGTNAYILRPPTFRYAFEATHGQQTTPDITCRAYITGLSTTPITTSTTSETTTTMPSTSESTTTSTTTMPSTSESTTTSTTTMPSTSESTTTSTTTMPTTSDSTTTIAQTTTDSGSIQVSGSVYKEWPEGSCKRMYGTCSFPVSSQIEPDTARFSIAFNSAVAGFQQWLGEVVDDTSTTMFTTMNKYAIRPGVLTYGFKTLYTGNAPPAIICSMATM